MAQDNVSLGSFNLSDLPPAPRGVPQIEVKFDIDANGIINVTATDTATKKEAKITIESKTKLTEDEINKLKEDAEKYADADKNKKEQVEIKNEAESFIYTTEKLIGGDLKDKISQKQGIDLTDLIKELREAMTANNNDAMKEKLEALKKQVGEITAEIYKNAQQSETPTGDSGETPTGDSKPGETPTGDSKPGETPTGDSKPGETPTGDSKPDETSRESTEEKTESSGADQNSSKNSSGTA